MSAAPPAAAGPLAPLLGEPGVTDVLVNGGGDVWVDRGSGLERSPLVLKDADAVRRIAVRLVSAAGRRLDDAAPFADARLADGSRVHAVLPPIAPDGVCLSIRVPRRRPFTLGELVACGSLPAAGAPVLERLVRARTSFLVTGGTGTGKTTVLAALLGLADPAHRIVIVEDAAELRPALPHVVRLEGRPANVEAAGGVTLRDLVRQALRMRPDRLVVGEVRGAECVDLLAALNSGHEGGCGTLHANSPADVPARLEALAALGGISRSALHSLLGAALQAVVHLERGDDGVRRIAEIGVVRRDLEGRALVEPGLSFRGGAVVTGRAAPALEPLLGRPRWSGQ